MQRPLYVSGEIESAEIRLGSRVGGRVKQVLVREGDTLKTGMPVIEFESWDLEEREKQAEAELAHREAALSKMTAGVRPEEMQAKALYDEAQAELSLKVAGPRPDEIAAARDRLTAASSELDQANREFDRISQLLAQWRRVPIRI